jgi:hypothetical protein
MKAFTKPTTIRSLKIHFAALRQSGEKARVSRSQSRCQEGLQLASSRFEQFFLLPL